MNSNIIETGLSAPSFKAIAIGGSYGENGAEISLKDFLGKSIVLYFYPKDDTPGCTKQACALRDNWEQVQNKAIVFGISPDSAVSHAKFIKKFNLPFPLLVDEDKDLAKLFGVWVEKSMFGKKFWGVERSSFIIDKEGKISAIFKPVKPEEHLKKVLEVL